MWFPFRKNRTYRNAHVLDTNQTCLINLRFHPRRKPWLHLKDFQVKSMMERLNALEWFFFFAWKFKHIFTLFFIFYYYFYYILVLLLFLSKSFFSLVLARVWKDQIPHKVCWLCPLEIQFICPGGQKWGKILSFHQNRKQEFVTCPIPAATGTGLEVKKLVTQLDKKGKKFSTCLKRKKKSLDIL